MKKETIISSHILHYMFWAVATIYTFSNLWQNLSCSDEA